MYVLVKKLLWKTRKQIQYIHITHALVMLEPQEGNVTLDSVPN